MAATTTKTVTKAPLPPVGVWLPPVVAAWAIPGAGHFLLKRRGRAALLMASIVLMFLVGLMMRGMMFTPESSSDTLSTVINYGGFVGNLASGALYIVSVMLGYAQPDTAGHVHDYGTKFLVTAGLLNILAMVDTFEIATGRKS